MAFVVVVVAGDDHLIIVLTFSMNFCCELLYSQEGCIVTVFKLKLELFAKMRGCGMRNIKLNGQRTE